MRRNRRVAACALVALLLAGCASLGSRSQPRFESPEVAAAALLRALDQGDQEDLLAVLGSRYRDDIVTPDWEAERPARERIAAAARTRLELQETEPGEIEIVVGEAEWPFPVPLRRDDDGRWYFDTAEGIEVLEDRRIGRNELTAIAILDAYVDAQIEYARWDWDDDGRAEYAQRLASSAGERDGLYWEAGPDGAPSPFGPMIEKAERYLETKEPGDPIRGYYFKVLTRQGENAPGGAYDYVVDGEMRRGFALVAYPADYGRSGIMTFVVNQRGQVQEKDIGPFRGMEAYDPDDSWHEVDEHAAVALQSGD